MPLPFTLFRSVGHAELPRRSARGQAPQDPPAGANLSGAGATLTEDSCMYDGPMNKDNNWAQCPALA